MGLQRETATKDEDRVFDEKFDYFLLRNI